MTGNRPSGPNNVPWSNEFLDKPQPPSETPPRQKSRATVILLVFAIVLTAVVMWDRLGRAGSLPPELLGTWRSDNPVYVDRSFDLTPDSLVIHQGEGRRAAYAIKEVKRREGGGTERYQVVYWAEAGTADWSFTYDARRQTLRLDGRSQVVWHKGEAPR